MKFTGHKLLATLTVLAVIATGSSAVFAARPSKVNKVDASPRLTSYVNPFIGTGGHGHVFLGANVPFGLVQGGPSQPVKGWDWCSGYHLSDSTLVGFSLTHLSGTGIGDLGDITFLPYTGGNDSLQTFSHSNEICRSGYYSVKINGSGIRAEISATERASIQRYTYPDSKSPRKVKLDLRYGIGWDRPVDTHIEVLNDSTISGWRLSRGWAPDQRIYFTAVFSAPFQKGETDTLGASKIARFVFAPSNKPLLVRTGISATSVANAANNLSAEIPVGDFDLVARNADAKWEKALGAIKATAKDPETLKVFYTSLYHTMTSPSVFSDVSGDYRGADGKIYNTGGKYKVHTTYSLWDTYRAAHPLSTLIHPELQQDYIADFIDIYQKQGQLPVWHLHGNETNCMVGNPGVIVLGDLILKGFARDAQQEEQAFQAMKGSMMRDDRGLADLKTYGYLAYDGQDSVETVAKSLEYAIADAATAAVAKRLGHKEDYDYFSNRSLSFCKLYDPETGFMRALSKEGKRRPGEFSPFHAAHRADDYCEGNAWQYLWLVPHESDKLCELIGGKDKFVSRLDSFFVAEGDLGAEASPDISGLIGQYAHGNEPGHHIIYLYSLMGKPEKAAPLLRKVMTEMYTAEPDGLCGNEDVGQMSAWYVLSAMGIYQPNPTEDKFVIGSPVLDSAVINVGDGKTFTIKALNNSPENICVRSMMLNGKIYNRPYITFDDLRHGGTLILEMSSRPAVR